MLSRVRVPLAASRAGIQGKENIYFSNFECECLSPSSGPPRALASTRHVEQVSLSVYTTLLRAARRREAENARLSPSRYLGREFAFFPHPQQQLFALEIFSSKRKTCLLLTVLRSAPHHHQIVH